MTYGRICINDGISIKLYNYTGVKMFMPTVNNVSRLRVHIINHHPSTAITVEKITATAIFGKNNITETFSNLTSNDITTSVI